MDTSRPTPRAKAALEQLVSTNFAKSDGYEHPDRWMYDQIEPVKAKATAPKPSIAIKSPPKRQSR